MLKRLKITNSNLASYAKVSIDSPKRHEQEIKEMRKETKLDKRSMVGRILL